MSGKAVDVNDSSLDEILTISYLRCAARATSNSRKRQKIDHLKPISFGRLQTTLGKSNTTGIKILFDSGSTASHVKRDKIKKLRVKKEKPQNWNTAAGQVSTNERCRVLFSLPELNDTRTIDWTMHVGTLENIQYDMIIGSDLMSELGINIKYSNLSIEWDDVDIPMRSSDVTPEESFHIQDTPSVLEATDRLRQILNAKYEKSNLDEIAANCTHLDEEEQSKLNQLLKKYEHLFDGTLGLWTGDDYEIELKEGATPYHSRAYPIPKIHERTLRQEVERLVKIGVLKRVNRSQWGAPTFIIPKKDKMVRFISDFRELNKRIKRKPYPIPRIQDLLLKLEGFQYATSLDLNMGYYHIELSPRSKELCTIVLPWGKYEYQKLPMGLCNSPDIFQEKMSTLLGDLEYVRAYIDDLLVTTSGDWSDHLEKLDIVFEHLTEAGLKVNAKKSFFGHSELEYLGYWITRDGIQPLSKKVEAIKNISPPKTKWELRRFIGIVNYYRDMWIRRSEILAPLSAITSKDAVWRWTDVEQQAFEKMKRIISRKMLLAYPDFNKPFEIHTDASHTQLSTVISQDNRPIAFYSRKLNPAQTRYTTTECELLSIVKTLKEFRNILLGHTIKVYTDHKNLTHKSFNTERVMQWRLILEEYAPELLYIKGENNVVADALSHLEMTETSPLDLQKDLHYLAECFGLDDDDLSPKTFPLQYKTIARHQGADKELLQKLKTSDAYTIQTFRGGGKSRTLICHNGKIVIPQTLQRRVAEWYHEWLIHPGETRTEQTIRQHLWWNNLRAEVHDVCSKCHTCQKTKRSTRKYGHLPEKEAQTDPWDVLCVDLIGPYTIKRRGKKSLTLWCVTMIDPATGWFEMKEITNKTAINVANIVDQTWFMRYPWPTQIIFDRGNEFMGEFSRMVRVEYGLT